MTNESFADLFGETAAVPTGSVIAGTIIDIQNDNAIIDVGLNPGRALKRICPPRRRTHN